MKKQKEAAASSERYIFAPEELQRLKLFQAESTDREEIIGLLDSYSGIFADWSVIINEAVQERITKKHQRNESCEKEEDMLKDIAFLFTRLTFFRKEISDWHDQLTLGNSLTDEMIRQGHP